MQIHLPDLLDQLLEKCTFPPSGTEVTCAVSGGPDSLALLALAVRSQCKVSVIHVDHGIRKSVEHEADYVASVCKKFGAEFESKSVIVEPGPNIEARARVARYAVLPDNVLTGHTLDDLVETVLMNMMRGAGLDGLVGMRSSGHPILSLRKSETIAVCKHLELEPVEDPMNLDMSLTRNRIRHQLIPLMNEIANRDVAPLVKRQSEQLEQDAWAMNELAAELNPQDAIQLALAPEALAARALRMWLRTLVDDEHHPPSAAAIKRVLAVARGEVKACEIEGGIRIARTQQRLRAEKFSG